MNPKIRKKSFSTVAAVDHDYDLEAAKRLAAGTQRHIDGMVLKGFGVGTAMNHTPREKNLTLDGLVEIMKSIPPAPKMIVGIVCRPSFAPQCRALLQEEAKKFVSSITRDAITTIPVHEKANQVENYRVFHDRAELAKYLGSKCPNDTDGDGDCHLCAKTGGCNRRTN